MRKKSKSSKFEAIRLQLLLAEMPELEEIQLEKGESDLAEVEDKFDGDNCISPNE